MYITMTRLTLAGLAFAGVVASAAAQTGRTQEIGPVYELEGAWYGTVTVAGRAPTASLDTYTSAAQRQGVQGTELLPQNIVAIQHSKRIEAPFEE